MKNITSLLFALALAFIVSTPVLAQDATPKTNTTRQRYQEKLQTISDEKKKTIVQKMDQRIGEMNSKRTAIMLRHLEQIEKILGRIEERTNKLASAGKDVSSVTAAITKAKEAIAAARTKVNAQAAKTYTITITSEATLDSAVTAVRTAFANDLKEVHQSVVSARRLVKDVLVALSQIVGEKLSNTTRE